MTGSTQTLLECRFLLADDLIETACVLQAAPEQDLLDHRKGKGHFLHQCLGTDAEQCAVGILVFVILDHLGIGIDAAGLNVDLAEQFSIFIVFRIDKAQYGFQEACIGNVFRRNVFHIKEKIQIADTLSLIHI